jgi:hypothetical protein
MHRMSGEADFVEDDRKALDDCWLYVPIHQLCHRMYAYHSFLTTDLA